MSAIDGIHDLGGMQGFGPVARDEATWHTAWERRVFGLSLSASLDGNIDDFRHSIERLDPSIYVTAGYFGRWLAALEVRCAERRLVSSDEVDGRAPGGRPARPTAVPSVSLPGPSSSSTQRRDVGGSPRFSAGDTVRVADVHPAGHTRLPRYARGRTGRIVRVHPAFVFPDTNAHGLGEDPQFVYAVEFAAAELWGAGDHRVMVDIFESHLEAA